MVMAVGTAEAGGMGAGGKWAAGIWGGGGDMGGGHMGGGGGHYGGGGGYHGGGGYYGGGGGMRVAPSHSYSPRISGASRMPSVSGHAMPSINSTHGTGGATRMNSAGSVSNVGRATGWNTASHAQLQHVNSNLS